MIVLLALAALLASQVPLVDEEITVPAAEWRAFDISFRQRPADIECKFTVKGHSGVRVVLMRAEEANRLRHDLSHQIIFSTPFRTEGAFRYGPAPAGDYALIVDNRMEGRGPAQVRIKVNLSFGVSRRAAPSVLPAGTRMTIIGVTLLTFGSILFFAARRLMPSLRARWGRPRTLAG
jgi:hypothetical protein